MSAPGSFFSGEQIRDLPTVGAYELYITAGMAACIGFPLPNGMIPVCAGHLGVVQVTAADVQSYRELCEAERRAHPVPAA